MSYLNKTQKFARNSVASYLHINLKDCFIIQESAKVPGVDMTEITLLTQQLAVLLLANPQDGVQHVVLRPGTRYSLTAHTTPGSARK